jgi:hypothetical protein
MFKAVRPSYLTHVTLNSHEIKRNDVFETQYVRIVGNRIHMDNLLLEILTERATYDEPDFGCKNILKYEYYHVVACDAVWSRIDSYQQILKGPDDGV